MTPVPPVNSRRRRFLAIAVVLVATLVPLLPAAPAAAAGPVGYVRLAHLSPDTPDVDVYLTAVTGGTPQRFPGVGYGTVSNYLTVPTGTYAVSMRAAGAPASDPPVLTTNVTVADGKAYTVAGVGKHADLGLKVIEDDLSLPPAPVATEPVGTLPVRWASARSCAVNPLPVWASSTISVYTLPAARVAVSVLDGEPPAPWASSVQCPGATAR